jgi:WD40 repeat protein
VEGGIKLWDPVTGREQFALRGHGNAVNALVALPRPDDATCLASADVEGVIRVWDPWTGNELCALAGHAAAIYALAIVPTFNGAMWLASADVEGVIRVWDPWTGRELQKLADRPDMLWDLALLPDRGWMASAGVDGKIHMWDTATWTKVGLEITHQGVIYSLAAIPCDDGTNWLASSGVDGNISVWDVETGVEVARLSGNGSAVRDLITVPRPDGGTWLASAGGDGVVRLWDVLTAQSAGRFEDHWGSVFALSSLDLHSIPDIISTPGGQDSPRRRDTVVKLGGIKTRGFGDRAAPMDLLGRTDFVEVTVELLSQSDTESATSGGGPSVVSIDGRWGCGKTTMMRLIKSRLDGISENAMQNSPSAGQHSWSLPWLRQRFSSVFTPAWFTVCAADWAMRRGAQARLPTTGPRRSTARSGVITAWFNPWAHQSHDQVWAGLAREIIVAARKVLYPDADRAERYWFHQNLQRLDRRDLKRMLWQRIASPLLRLSIFALLIPIVAVIAEDQFHQKSADIHLFGREVSAGAVALLIPLGVLIIGLTHTLIRYLVGRASSFLPSEIFRGPLMSSTPPNSSQTSWTAVDDPMYNAPSGYLYLLQHDIKDLLKDVRDSGYELVVFIDDLDRCSPKATAEMFEAINLFISEAFPRVRFVIGLDPVIVAAHIDYTYEHLLVSNSTSHPSDPSPGWTFLRKLIQLPIIVPRIRERTLDGFLDDKLGSTEGIDDSPPRPQPTTLLAEEPKYQPVSVATSVEANLANKAPGAAENTQASGHAIAPSGRSKDSGKRSRYEGLADQSLSHVSALDSERPSATQLAMERHPEVRAQIRSRLDAQLDRSARHAKRLLTVWQFYVRLCQRVRPLRGEAAASRACALVLVAEVMTRWPAWLHYLTATVDGVTALQLLAASADDDGAWNSALTEVGLGVDNQESLHGLRDLLRSSHGAAAADLFTAVT